ncbi:(2E,6E)-farnesyl diphosphate synthase [Celerinatantimonas diazotrophica]|uniref:Farnesyl-diphosphate synthase n=1 Tax=Celerinatantimonas diazotrophica TaxID=412034 RepID=A0A4R1K3M9_9GAMM|nr:(2E,6E)-farnesyl diphosphate synthase [Celerinatantimonas diazotrophica]TCK58682.1 farnesyl-diphosphate synthase [Celerinatantimonas diazotrophica]CAG9297311.1 Farnesyl diphosphate synthase [Celerinatantimonas diazotrophica]
MSECLQTILESYRERVDTFILQQLNSLEANAPVLRDAMRYSLVLGGKRIRPVLVYLTAELNQAPTQQVDYVAAAVEAIHAYSLIHDDLPAMDDDKLRRGQPTCHIAFDEATAILAGDALQSWAFTLLTQAQQIPAHTRLTMVQTLSQAAGLQGMCAGQSIDIMATGQRQSLEELEQMHRLKTGALIRAAIQLGAQAAGISKPAERQALDNYGAAIGLAFQVRDDILDVIADTETLGKPQGSDIEHHKSTYPGLLGLAQAEQKCQNLRHQALHELDTLPYNTNKLAALADFIIQRNK